MFGAWFGAVTLAQKVHPSATWHGVALFAHLAALVVGLGAVMVVDWLGLLWVLGRRTFVDVTRTASAVHVLIWVGFTALVLSGILLEPNTSTALTRLKLALVLVIAVNGLHAHALQSRLHARDDVPPDLLARGAVTAVVSQVGWWAAVGIGYLNTAR